MGVVGADPLVETVVGAAWAPPVVPFATWGTATVAAAVALVAVGTGAALLLGCATGPLAKVPEDDS